MISRFLVAILLTAGFCSAFAATALSQEEDWWATFSAGYMEPYTYLPADNSVSGEALSFDGGPLVSASVERTLGEGFSLLVSGGFVGFSDENPDNCLAASDPDCLEEMLRVHFFPFAFGLKGYLPTDPDGRFHGFLQVSPALYFADWQQTVEKTSSAVARFSLTMRAGFILGGGGIARISSKLRAELGAQYWFSGDFDVEKLNGISNRRLQGLRQFAILLGVAYAP